MVGVFVGVALVERIWTRSVTPENVFTIIIVRLESFFFFFFNRCPAVLWTHACPAFMMVVGAFFRRRCMSFVAFVAVLPLHYHSALSTQHHDTVLTEERPFSTTPL